MLAAALLPAPPLLDTRDGTPPTDARLVRSPAFVALSPALAVLDAMTLLDERQHAALLLTALAAFAAWRLLRRGRRRGLRRAGEELVALSAAVTVALLVYAGGALIPRPMAALAVDDRDTVVVDLHSHTAHSHDTRAAISAEHNRRWHAAAGYHAAFVADHDSWDGFDAATAANPPVAAGGTLLLSALEARYAGGHVAALGTERRYRHALERGRLRPERLDTGDATLILTLPNPALAGSSGAEPWRAPGVVAIEIVDGDPRGLGQGRRHRARLLALAARHGLTPVAGSNYHGWGYTAAGWTLIRIPGWQRLDADRLAARIEQALHERPAAVRVVERSAPPASGAALAATTPLLALHVLRTLSPAERLAWILWVWILAAAPRLRPYAARRRQPSTIVDRFGTAATGLTHSSAQPTARAARPAR